MKLKKKEKFLATITLLALVLSQNINVYADEIVLGSGIIENPNSTVWSSSQWSGSYVYFGKDENSQDVKYRVLDANATEYGGNSILIQADSILWYGEQYRDGGQSSAFDDSSNEWEKSDLCHYLNGTEDYEGKGFVDTWLTAGEKNALLSSVKESPSSKDYANHTADVTFESLTGQKVFLLDAAEVTSNAYGYLDAAWQAAGRRLVKGECSQWWLRSPSKFSKSSAGIVYTDGYIYDRNVGYESIGVVPAMNIDKSKILYTKRLENNEFKLTLINEDNRLSLLDGNVYKKGDKITIPYSYEGEEFNRMAILCTEKTYNAPDASFVFVASTPVEYKEKGAVELDLLCDIEKGNHVYLYAYNDNYSVYNSPDIVSQLLEITVPDVDSDYTYVEEETTKTPEIETKEADDDEGEVIGSSDDDKKGDNKAFIIGLLIAVPIILAVVILLTRKKDDN